MDDLISRKALLDYLRNDFGFRFPFYDGTRLGTTQLLVTMNDVIAAIQHIVPSVDAVPVVRCRDCIHRGYDACPMCHDECGYDEDDGYDYWTVDNTTDDGFCNMGAKLDGGADNGRG